MIPLPEKIKVISANSHQASLEFSPLYPGFGVTVGNALRRVLLSSIEGAAITTVKIKDVSHEFSTIPGVLENVIEILMNIKRIRMRSFSAEPVMLTLKISGEKEVTAGDIKANSEVEIINKKQLIATITDKKTVLEMEMTVEKGIGYVPVEQRQKEKISVGTLAVDAAFTPVINVNMSVENIRVGQRTDYNKLLLEIETDGTVSPLTALTKSVSILNEHLTLIEVEETKEEKSFGEDEEKSKGKKSTAKKKKKANE